MWLTGVTNIVVNNQMSHLNIYFQRFSEVPIPKIKPIYSSPILEILILPHNTKIYSTEKVSEHHKLFSNHSFYVYFLY